MRINDTYHDIIIYHYHPNYSKYTVKNRDKLEFILSDYLMKANIVPIHACARTGRVTWIKFFQLDQHFAKKIGFRQELEIAFCWANLFFNASSIFSGNWKLVQLSW